MLDVMRRGSQNIFVKGFLGLLALSFVIWGVGDVFRGRSASNSVATVGGVHVSYEEYDNMLRRELARYQEATGKAPTEDEIEQFGIKNMVINQLVDGKIIKTRMDDIKFKVGQAAASDQIYSNAMFADDSGKFSMEKFDSIMQANNLKKSYYIDSVKLETSIRLFLDGLMVAPKSLENQAKALYGYRNQERIADVVTVSPSLIGEVDDPAETELVQYYQEHSKEFSIPEVREASYILFSIDDVKKDIKISDADLKEAYDNNLSAYKDAEKRNIEQYLFDSEADAKAALDDLKKGIADKKYDSKRTALGDVDKDSLPAEVSGAVFSLEKNVFSEPVKSEMGWHVFIVKNISEPQTRSFESVKKTLEDELRESKASEQFSEYSSKIEDDFAAGTTLEEVAKKHDLKVVKIAALDAEGKDANGKEIAGISNAEVLLPVLFNTDAGAVSPLTLLPDNRTYAAVRADKVTPQRERALDEVKGSVIVLWKASEKEKRLKALADDVAKKLKDGGDFAKIVESKKLKVTPAKKFDRADIEAGELHNDVPFDVEKQLFDIKVGEATDAYKAADGSFVIARLKQINKAAVQETKLHNFESNLKEDFTDDILRQYNVFLRKEYPVELNEKLMRAAVN
jgi:peptidyl-prolyl cis-trans isomerase D